MRDWWNHMWDKFMWTWTWTHNVCVVRCVYFTEHHMIFAFFFSSPLELFCAVLLLAFHYLLVYRQRYQIFTSLSMIKQLPSKERLPNQTTTATQISVMCFVFIKRHMNQHGINWYLIFSPSITWYLANPGTYCHAFNWNWSTSVSHYRMAIFSLLGPFVAAHVVCVCVRLFFFRFAVFLLSLTSQSGVPSSDSHGA